MVASTQTSWCPWNLDTLYYLGVLHNRGIFVSDQTLLASAPTIVQVWQSVYRRMAVGYVFPSPALADRASHEIFGARGKTIAPSIYKVNVYI
jgi:hypothetical protein